MRRIRETLEPLRSASWTVLALGRKTYVKIKGRWTYLYRAVDEGEERQLPVARQAGRRRGQSLLRACFQASGPATIKTPLDGYQASHRAAKEALDEFLPEGNQCKIQIVRYLNNLIEQNNRSVS